MYEMVRVPHFRFGIQIEALLLCFHILLATTIVMARMGVVGGRGGEWVCDVRECERKKAG